MKSGNFEARVDELVEQLCSWSGFAADPFGYLDAREFALCAAKRQAWSEIEEPWVLVSRMGGHESGPTGFNGLQSACEAARRESRSASYYDWQASAVFDVLARTGTPEGPVYLGVRRYRPGKIAGQAVACA
ncbi:MAG: hypothetical protein ACKVQA_21170 [Burkholderiales bacterium]